MDMDEVSSIRREIVKINKLLEEGYTKTLPKKLTYEDVKLLKKYKKENFVFSEISGLLNRSEVSVRVKWKRINKKNNTYNKSHIKEKYDNNLYFINDIKPRTILDVFAGEYSYYEKLEKKLKLGMPSLFIFLLIKYAKPDKNCPDFLSLPRPKPFGLIPFFFIHLESISIGGPFVV